MESSVRHFGPSALDWLGIIPSTSDTILVHLGYSSNS